MGGALTQPLFTRAWLNFFTLTFRALGRNHIASTPITSHRNALIVRFLSVPVLSQLLVACRETPQRGPSCGHPRASTPRSGFSLLLPPDGERVDICQPTLCPPLRANPFPEVTDPFCRLPLPTLFYQLEAVHLGEVIGMTGRENHPLPRIFMGRRECTGHHHNCCALPDNP